MLLLHTVLAVAYGGLLVSARPDLGRVRGGEEAELIDDGYSYAQNDVVEDDAQYNWAPDAPQLVMDAAQVPYYTDPEEVESNSWDGDFPRPKVPGHFPSPPEEIPNPPEHLPKPPHFPPHEPPHPGSPGPPPHEPGHHRPHFPGHHPHHPPGAPSNVTIYQFLEHNPRFSRIFNIVNHTEDVTKLLNDSSVNVTFFALPDWGFPRPHHRPVPPEEDGDFDFEEAFTSGDDIGDILATAEGFLNTVSRPGPELKNFLKLVLLYQTLPSRLPTSELAKNLTHPTSLTVNDGSLDGEPFRVRVGRAPGLLPHLGVNLFSKIIRPNIPTANGLIHVVNKPVLPPPSAFQTTFLFQGAFSTLTSALQRVGLTDALEWRNVEGGTVDGSPAVTFFAPTNQAFQRLPRNLRLFLFSPFGEKALKKLLQYHIVPEFVFHTNYLHNASDSDFVPSEHDTEYRESYEQLDYGELDLAELLGETSESLEYGDNEGSSTKPLNGKFNWKVPSWQFACANEQQRRSWTAEPHPEDSAYSHDGPQDWVYDGQQQSHRYPDNQYSSYSYAGTQDSWYSYGRPDHSAYYSYDGPMTEGPERYEAYQDSYRPSPGHFTPPRYPPPPSGFEHRCPCHGPPPPPFAHHGPPHHWSPTPPPFHQGPAHWGPPPPHHGPPPLFDHDGSPRCGPLPPLPFHHERPHGWGSRPSQSLPHNGCPHHWGPLQPPPFAHDECPLSPKGPHPPLFPNHEGLPHFPPRPHHPPFPRHGPWQSPHFPTEHGPNHGPGHHCVPLPHQHGPPHHFPHHKKPHFPSPPHPPIAYSLNITAPTLLTNHSLDVHVVQFAQKSPLPWKKQAHYETLLFVHGVKVKLADVPLRNGALHVIETLLNPLKKSKGPHHPPHHPPETEQSWGSKEESFAFEDETYEEEDEWAGWQEWLPRWADE
ncbi:hypothetical protein OH76DRAFT_1559064 [Lentinus brumalis]|uniref:FAS1 domain-containing protein n=1 Tax=Lentinus brumalis TaxID=2498619 RepID=A0A371CYR4_9APHY|nr:hypothetical protein OH76DRAFT_1559064 [Polyporus brumalis]